MKDRFLAGWVCIFVVGSATICTGAVAQSDSTSLDPAAEVRWLGPPDCTAMTNAIPRNDNENNRNSDVTIFQFVRFKTEGSPYELGAFGYLDSASGKIDWCGIPHDPRTALLVNAVNASNVPLSGSIVVFNVAEPDCRKQAWKIVAEAVESSNILLYDSSQVSIFCHAKAVIIVLPVHAIWANVFFSPANFSNPAWKPIGDVPLGHDCFTGDQVGPDPRPGEDPPPVERFYPQQQIRPCDLIAAATYLPKKAKWYQFYHPRIAWIYNRLTQPGVTQGTASIAPFNLTPKGTYDAQAYVSTRWGPGWFGLTSVFEHDMSLKDDMNSLTGALTYDWRWRDKSEPQPPQSGASTQNENALQQFGTSDQNGNQPSQPGKRWLLGTSIHNSTHFLPPETPETPKSNLRRPIMPPVFGVRWPEFNVRFGPEFTPGGPEVTTHPIKVAPPEVAPTAVAQRKLNLVAGATTRLPLIFSFEDQPSAITVLPVLGFEAGVRDNPPDIPELVMKGGNPGVVDVAEPPNVARLVGGVDGSLRSFWSMYENFLGNKPITLDFSYRLRRLFSAEPSIDVSHSPVAETLRGGSRGYDRVTLIVPYSAYLQLRLIVATRQLAS